MSAAQDRAGKSKKKRHMRTMAYRSIGAAVAAWARSRSQGLHRGGAGRSPSSAAEQHSHANSVIGIHVKKDTCNTHKCSIEEADDVNGKV